MNKSIRRICAVTMAGALLAGSVPAYQGLAASKKLKVDSKNIVLTVGKTKTLSANMTATFQTSDKKVVAIKKTGKTKCTLIAKKQGDCTILVKAKKQKTIKVRVKVKKATPKTTKKPVATTTPTKKPVVTTAPPAESATPLETPTVTPPAIVPIDEETMGNKVNNLGYHLSKLLAQTEEENGNRVISSYSIMMALTMLDNGAAGETKEELEKTLGIQDLDAWNQEFSKHFMENCNDTIQNHDINESEKESDSFFEDNRFEAELSSANSFWYNDSVLKFDSREQKDYMNRLAEYYKAESRPLDFSNPDRNPKNDVNQWVEEKTAGKIKNLINDNFVKEITSAVLVNTLYFNGCWSDTFQEKYTSEEEFYGKDGITTVDMMYNPEVNYRYYEQGDIMGVELPFYGNNDIVMDVITTKEQDKDVVPIYEQMSDAEKNQWYQSLGKAGYQLVNLYLPKFKLEYGTVDVTEQLKKLGLDQTFDVKRANLPGIRGENERNMYVDKVLHKAVIEVGESGATAAAATAIIVDCETSVLNPEPPKTIDFHVNRPFVFAIRDKKTNMIYFMGQIENLEKK